jgi:Transposase DDE domain
MLTVPFKLNQDRRHHIPRQRHKVTNWPKYEASLRQRASLTVWFTEEAIATWAAAARTTRGGQPWYSPLAILTALTLRAVFRLAFRQTEGLIGSIISLLGLTLRVPDHTTLSRRAAILEVPRPQRQPGAHAEALHLLVDSTGLKLCGAGEWLVEKHGTKARRSWRKLHLGVDAGTGQIMTSALTSHDTDDASQIGPLLDQVRPDKLWRSVKRAMEGVAVDGKQRSGAVLGRTLGSPGRRQSRPRFASDRVEAAD